MFFSSAKIQRKKHRGDNELNKPLNKEESKTAEFGMIIKSEYKITMELK